MEQRTIVVIESVVPEGDSPESFAAYVKADIAKWKRVIEQANVPKI